ncbi:Stromal cell-derived factor 1 [Manis javanica]|nr:Stromal cell-derived factor 1 [Manis javanica]
MGTVPSPAAQPSCAAGPSPEVKLAEQAPRNVSGSERSSPGHPGAGGGGREGPEPEERSVGGTLVGAPEARDAAPGPPLAGPRLLPSPLNSPSLASRLCACPCRRRVRCASSRCRCHGCQGHRRAGPCAGCGLSQRRETSQPELQMSLPILREPHCQRQDQASQILNTPNCALQIVARLKNNNRQACIDPKLKWIQEYLEKALNKRFKM